MNFFNNQLTTDEYEDLKKRVKEYTYTIRINEANGTLKRKAIKDFEGFLSTLHYTESRFKSWLYRHMNREATDVANKRLKQLWDDYLSASAALAAVPAAASAPIRQWGPPPSLSDLLDPNGNTAPWGMLPYPSNNPAPSIASDSSESNAPRRGRTGRPSGSKFKREHGVFAFQADSNPSVHSYSGGPVPGPSYYSSTPGAQVAGMEYWETPSAPGSAHSSLSGYHYGNPVNTASLPVYTQSLPQQSYQVPHQPATYHGQGYAGATPTYGGSYGSGYSAEYGSGYGAN